MIRPVLKAYFRHPRVVGLSIFFVILLVIDGMSGLLSQYAGFIILPFVIAPFYEWFMHKYVLHAKLSKRYPWLRSFQIRLHHEHHRLPHKIEHQFAPPVAVLIHLVLTYVLFALLTWSFVIAWVPFTFGVLYYLFYEWMHLAHHTPSYRAKTPIGRRLQQSHMRHHFHNERYCWGITNYLGDICFDTLKEIKTVSKSATTRTIAGYQPTSTNKASQ